MLLGMQFILSWNVSPLTVNDSSGPEGVEQPADVDVGEIVIRPTAQT
jgi:hypothetical protein